MLGVLSAAECSRKVPSGSPPLPFSLCRVIASVRSRYRTPPEPKTRNGLSLAGNDACAPLRGRCSRPVPSLSRQNSSANPFDLKLFRSASAFDTVPGEFSAPDPLSALRSAAVTDSPVSTPLRAFQPSGSNRSTGHPATGPLRLTLALLCLPYAVSFDPAPDSK